MACVTDNNRTSGGGDGAAAFTPGPAQMIAVAVANAVAQVLAQQLPSAIATGVQAAQPQQPRYCATCLSRRVIWELNHETQMQDAIAAACAETGVPFGSPQALQLDFAPYLPVGLRPGDEPEGLPPLRLSLTVVQGTETCPQDLPGVQQAAGKKQFLIASGPWGPAQMARLTGKL